VQLTKKEGQNDILMIGGIGIFLSSSHEEAENSVIDGAATEEQSQLMMNVEEKELVQMV
jgi:hypothetical protein